MIELTTTTTTTLSEIEKNRYRFGGVRYQLQGSDKTGPHWMVYEIPGLMSYPRGDDEEDLDI